MELSDVPPRWVTLTATADELPVITLVDEAVALAAPFPSHPVQVGFGVQLNEPDRLGQPGEAERAQLRRIEQVLVDGMARSARMVASLTLQGVREYVAYAVSDAFLLDWQEMPPAGLDTHDIQVLRMDDPTWKGLREIAGLLEPGEEPLRPPG